MLPSAEMSGRPLAASPSTPVEETETRVMTPVTMSRTKTSSIPFVSPATRSEALEVKAT